ncbi:MAG: hypothetical protein ABIH41_03515, partial [Nanoarchaeota archaeon]
AEPLRPIDIGAQTQSAPEDEPAQMPIIEIPTPRHEEAADESPPPTIDADKLIASITREVHGKAKAKKRR